MTEITTYETLQAALNALAPELADRAAEMDDARRLPADLAGKMAAAGAFRMMTPKTYGGLELTAREFIEGVEQIARANASAGWCCMIACTTSMNAAYMAPDMATEIYADPLTITGGVFAPMGRADVEGDGYRVSGRWQWGSGSANCSWLAGGCMVFEDGELKRLPSGAPDQRMMVFPASEATLHDTWHVMGLKGTGSGDLSVDNIFVPAARSVSLITDVPRETGPLYTFPAFGLLSLGVSAVAMGNARASLDAFKDLASAKKSQGSRKTLAERQTIQASFAEAEAQWRAARAYMMAELDETWEHLDLWVQVQRCLRARPAADVLLRKVKGHLAE